MADAESRPIAGGTEGARQARSNYIIYLVGVAASLVSVMLVDSGDAWGAGPGALSLFQVAILIAVSTAIPLIIALVRAYMGRKKANEVTVTHFRLQIRTFWLCGLYGVAIGMATLLKMPDAVSVVGWIYWVSIDAWMITRCIKGLECLARQEPYPNPRTWLW